MWTISLEEVIEATGGRLLFGTANGVKGISIDSRTIGEGEMFVAIKGARFDGHDFLGEALRPSSMSQAPLRPCRTSPAISG
jgi:UDP-N-acetylmuramoyl-tripeptide--D-alanyl-D-alanine ligase